MVAAKHIKFIRHLTKNNVNNTLSTQKSQECLYYRHNKIKRKFRTNNSIRFSNSISKYYFWSRAPCDDGRRHLLSFFQLLNCCIHFNVGEGEVRCHVDGSDKIITWEEIIMARESEKLNGNGVNNVAEEDDKV